MKTNGLTTISGAAEYLDLSRTRVYQLMKDGDLAYIKLPGPNGHRRVRWVDLTAMLKRLRKKA